MSLLVKSKIISKKRIISFLLIGIALLFAFQNCSLSNNGLFEVNQNQKPDSTNGSGNGDGYIGMQVRGPVAVVPGEAFRIYIFGGLPEFTISVSISSRIVSLSEREFEITIDDSTDVGQLEITIHDSTNSEIKKSLKVEAVESGSSQNFGFGSSATMTDQTKLLISSPSFPPQEGANYPQGKVDVYSINDNGKWEVSQSLSPSDNRAWGKFGSLLVSHKNELFVGNHIISARDADDKPVRNVGRVSVYDLVGQEYVFKQFLLPPDAANQMDLRFGYRIRVTDDYLFVASQGYYNGSIFIYKKEGSLWEYHQTLSQPTEGPQFYFYGQNIIVKDSTLVVASIGSNHWYSVDIYKLVDGRWSFSQNLKEYNGFGVQTTARGQLHFDGDSILLTRNNGLVPGASNEVRPYRDGWVFVFSVNELGTYEMVQKISSPFLEKVNAFGSSISVFNGQLIVASPGRDYGEIKEAGSIVLYSKNSEGLWEYQREVFAPEVKEGLKFGTNLNKHRNGLLVSAGNGEKLFLLDFLIGLQGQMMGTPLPVMFEGE